MDFRLFSLADWTLLEKVLPHYVIGQQSMVVGTPPLRSDWIMQHSSTGGIVTFITMSLRVRSIMSLVMATCLPLSSLQFQCQLVALYPHNYIAHANYGECKSPTR